MAEISGGEQPFHPILKGALPRKSQPERRYPDKENMGDSLWGGMFRTVTYVLTRLCNLCYELIPIVFVTTGYFAVAIPVK